MLLFRSEEELDRWRADQDVERGGVVPAEQLQRLAALWYGDRLDPGWRPRTPDQSQRILTSVGLTGDFWRLT